MTFKLFCRDVPSGKVGSICVSPWLAYDRDGCIEQDPSVMVIHSLRLDDKETKKQIAARAIWYAYTHGSDQIVLGGLPLEKAKFWSACGFEIGTPEVMGLADMMPKASGATAIRPGSEIKPVVFVGRLNLENKKQRQYAFQKFGLY